MTVTYNHGTEIVNVLYIGYMFSFNSEYQGRDHNFLIFKEVGES